MMALIVVAVVIGLLLPVQAGVNAQLRLTLGHPLTTAFVSFAVGTLGLGLLLLFARVPAVSLRSLEQAPAWQWVGGLLGAVYIAAAVVLAPRLGAATMIASIVTGQMLASVALDHFGWVGFPQHAATLPRLLGAVLIVVGVALIRK